eukprot:scaffold91415_cov61-Attheya_sp.AAC.5
MSESDQKPSATSRNKNQAFDMEALQELVANTAQTAAETTASIKELTKNLSMLETASTATDKKLAKAKTTIESQPDTIAGTICNDLRNDIDNLRDKRQDLEWSI